MFDQKEIAQTRERLGLSRSELATKLEIPYRTLQSWEIGERIPPNWVLNLLMYYLYNELAKR